MSDDEFQPRFSKKDEKKSYLKPMMFVSSVKNESESIKTKNEQIVIDDDEDDESQEFIEEIVDLSESHRGEIPNSTMNNASFRQFMQQEAPKSSSFEIIGGKPTKKVNIDPNSIQIAKQRENGFAGFLVGTKTGKNVMGMMTRMGYDPNRGLGKNKEGIVNPIQLKVTTRGRGAFVDNQKDTQSKSTSISSLEPKQTYWKKNSKVKIKYITADELSGKKDVTALKTMEIVDLTGKTERTVMNASEITSGSNKIVPELEFNLRQLVLMTEGEIKSTQDDIKRSEDQMSHLKTNSIKLMQQMTKTKNESTSLNDSIKVLNHIQLLVGGMDENPNYIQDITQTISLISNTDVYEKYQIGQAVVSLLIEPLRSGFIAWNISKDPLYQLETFRKWKSILKDDEYRMLFTNVVMPRLRKYFMVIDLKGSQAFDKIVFESWKAVMPARCLEIIEDSMVQSIKDRIEKWDPSIELIDEWFRPWYIILSQKLEQGDVMVLIRAKIQNQLAKWNPDDQSAHDYLQDWKTLFSLSDMNKILTKSILPKLNSLIKNLEVNPRNQDIKSVKNVFLWRDIVPIEALISIFEVEFFPKWRNALFVWLNQDPDLDEIFRWYEGWKVLFPDEFKLNSRFKQLMSKGLDMINQALSNESVTLTDNRIEPSGARKPNEYTFRELIENYAADLNLDFFPKGVLYQGKQVYLFGDQSIFLDNECIYVMLNGRWTPTSIKDLVAMTQPQR